MFAIQRGDGAGTRIGQTLLSLAYAAQNNMNFGGFFPGSQTKGHRSRS